MTLLFERKYSVGIRRVWEGKMLDGLVQEEKTDSENVCPRVKKLNCLAFYSRI